MDNALYVLLSKEVGLFQQMDVISDNLANSETLGFKNKDMIFKEITTKDAKNQKLSFSDDISTVFNINQGPIQMTDKTLDFAINGPGFFKILTPLGEAYTRAGNFTITQNGQLVNNLGYSVASTGGTAIVFDDKAIDIKVNKNGIIVVNNLVLDQLAVVNFDNYQKLIPIGASLFTIGSAVTSEEGNNQIIQGALEGSNVNKIKQLSDSIEVQRGTTSIINLINSIDNTEKSLVKNLLRNE